MNKSDKEPRWLEAVEYTDCIYGVGVETPTTSVLDMI